MTRFLLIAAFALSSFIGNGQSLKLGYFPSIPSKIRSCGALYTYDSVSLQKKKFIFLADFQNLGLIILNGKQIKLDLKDSKTIGKENITVYSGGGYTITLRSTMKGTSGKYDLEKGTLEMKKGTLKQTYKVQGQSWCDPASQEGNG
ncbi:MAG: hypothetical protein EOO88_59660 [Pedobacter sp.]|nr:MAG: hypothetical protein EOO88_59660 [Pedobacter sp.]